MRPFVARALAAAVAALVSAACAQNPAPRGPVAFPAEDDYERPSVSGLDARHTALLETAWEEIGVGDVDAATRRLSDALRKQPEALSLRAAVGYAHLRAGRLDTAQAEFETVLAADRDHRSALVGAATTARRQGRTDDALALYRRARESVDNPVLDRRILELSTARADGLVSDARKLRSEGRLEDAVTAYARALEAAPALGGLRIEWADALTELGRFDEAVKVLEASDPADRVSRLHLARLLAADGNIARAVEVLDALHAALPGDTEVRDRLSELRRSRVDADVPPEVRDIADAQWATRGDLAALLVATVPDLKSAEGGVPPVATDIQGIWMREYVLKALALELMETYPNHTFQPEATVRRGDLGHALGRALARVGLPPGNAPAMKDVTPNNRMYPEIARSVAAGLLPLTGDGAFEPWRPVTGAEAVRAVGALSALLQER